MAKRKTLYEEPSKKTARDFEKILADKNFVKRILTTQTFHDKDFRILDLSEDGKLWFVNLENELLLYNEETKKLLSYGCYFDKENPARVQSSKDIPRNDAREAAQKDPAKRTKRVAKKNAS